MKKIFTNVGILTTKRWVLAAVLPLLCAMALIAQTPTMSINQDVSGTYLNQTMTDRGAYWQKTYKEAAAGQAAGIRNWQFNYYYSYR